MSEIPEIEYLRKQGGSTFCGGSASWDIPRICYLCGANAEKWYVWDDPMRAYVCGECDRERYIARRNLKRLELDG